MPFMEITPEMIGPERTRLSLVYIETLMLWPHDPDQRAEAMKTGTVSFIHDSIANVPSARRSVKDTEWFDWISLAADAMPLRIIHQQSQHHFVQGVIAGELLSAIVGDHASGQSIKVQSIKNEIIECCASRKSDHFRISLSTLENTIWKRYKPVSHLWAAYLGNALRGDHVFPCRIGALPEFLGLSEYFRKTGQDIYPSRRNEPVLTQNEQWIPPSDLELPIVGVTWGDRPSRLNRSRRR